MGFHIDERFVVKAPAAAVWRYLIDPRRVVTCLPGAELNEVVDARTFHGTVKVKVGPVLVAYRGRVLLGDVDETTRRVTMRGEGRESTGAGSAKMSMESVMTTLPGGETEVVVRADVDVVGRAVQLGRGMLEQVSAQLFRQFAECVRKTIEAEMSSASTAAAAVSTTAPAGASDAAPEGGPAPAGHRPPMPTDSQPLARKVEPVRAIPLLLHALWAMVGAFFRRLVGGKRKHASTPAARSRPLQ